MSDTDLRDQAVAELKLTTVGYLSNPAKGGCKHDWILPPGGTHWWRAMDLLAQIGAAPSPAPTALGGGLPARLPVSGGSTIQVASLAELRAAFSTAAPGQTVMLTAALDLGGQTLEWSRYLSGSPVTFDEAAPGLLRNGGLRITGSWFRTHVAVQFAPTEGIKLTYSTANPNGCGYVEVDLRGKLIQGAKGQGILRTLPTAVNPPGPVQIWNVRVKDSGTNTTLDHGIYAARLCPGDVIANFSCANGQAYGIQLYPNCQGAIVTCCTLDAGRTRSGVVCGTETAGQTHDNKVVGVLVTNPLPGYTFHDYQGGPSNVCYDCSAPAPGSMAQVGFSTDPQHLIDPARYPLIPPLDIDGKPRPAQPRVGCVA